MMVAEHHGDTRGQDWYTDMTCLAVDATLILVVPPVSPRVSLRTLLIVSAEGWNRM